MYYIICDFYGYARMHQYIRKALWPISTFVQNNRKDVQNLNVVQKKVRTKYIQSGNLQPKSGKGGRHPVQICHV